jgi:hypothetical protein
MARKCESGCTCGRHRKKAEEIIVVPGPPEPKTFEERLSAQHQALIEAHRELRQRQFEKLEQAKASLAAGDAVPPEKTFI